MVIYFPKAEIIVKISTINERRKMTALLKKAFEIIRKRPAAQQDAIAVFLSEHLEQIVEQAKEQTPAIHSGKEEDPWSER